MILRDTTLDDQALAIVSTALKVLVEESHATLALLIGEDGYVYSREGIPDLPDMIGLATLVAASFGAARETAKVAGETNFESTFWKGEKNGIFVVRLSTNHLLVALFTDNTTLGLVKVYAEKIAVQLGILLTERSHDTEFTELDPQKGRWKDIVEALRGGGTEPLDL